MNSPTETHALRTKRLSFAKVSVTNQYEVGRDANQSTLVVPYS